LMERGCDAQSGRLQEIASEVLRLRLLQNQHRQLELQLQQAADELLQLPADHMLQLRGYLDQGLRPGGGAGTLGGLHGGAEPESLIGLMECLCVVCDTQVHTRRQEDILTATQRLLKDPKALVHQLSGMPVAASGQSRRLAPFLSCEAGWKGPLGDAGNCYEKLRVWLSCYYQFSLVNNQRQTTTQQLHQQERLLNALSGQDGSTGGIGGPNRFGCWRQASVVQRSSSHDSNATHSSNTSHSPTTQARAVKSSPRQVGMAAVRCVMSSSRSGLGTADPSSSSMKSSNARLLSSTKSTQSGPSLGIEQRVARSKSPLQPSSSRSSLPRAEETPGRVPARRREGPASASRVAATSPPLSCRSTRPEPQSARSRQSQGTPVTVPCRSPQTTPLNSSRAVQGSSTVRNSARKSVPRKAESGGTPVPALQRRNQALRSSLPVSSNGALASSVSALNLGGHPDAGSGGTGAEGLSCSRTDWAGSSRTRASNLRDGLDLW